MKLSARTLSMPGVGVAMALFIWRVFALPVDRERGRASPA